ncbi:hypothetical protein [Synechococcus sp. C9]|jgi:hypothetical protein|uniref:hypothetical protein n=1 Tax=Synechococcus sp. C9 TaxID=102119 RepID=UPI001FF5774F|nr:hypothetical protein [Synechococcus sp. C9]
MNYEGYGELIGVLIVGTVFISFFLLQFIITWVLQVLVALLKAAYRIILAVWR